MIDHIVVLETSPGSADVLGAALAGWDAKGDPKILRLPEMASGSSRRYFHGLFLACCEEIEAFARERNIRPCSGRLVIVADRISWFDLNPLKAAGYYSENERSASAFVSLLVLGFPEALWGIAWATGESPSHLTLPRAHLLEDWIANGQPAPFDPLMDISGLRDCVRRAASASLKSNDPAKTDESEDAGGGAQLTHAAAQTQEFFPCRAETAVAIDDESAYAYFNALTLYRHGFRAAPVDLWVVAEYLCGRVNPALQSPPMVSIEDLYMSFPDVPLDSGNIHLSNLDERDREFPSLKRSQYRIILTSGHKRKNSNEILRAIKVRGAVRMLKPIGGMFSLWKQSGLWNWLRRKDQNRRGWVGGYAPSYHPGVWTQSQESVNHSAPGALVAIAESLIRRVLRIDVKSGTVEDVVLGAVLATDAFELLASRTPTLSLDALVLKHEFEIRAECCFNGVQTKLDVRSRLRMIQRAAKMLSQWYDPWHQDIARWNAEAVVLTRVKAVFREYEQYEEELLYSHRSRTLHRRLWYRQRASKRCGPYIGKIDGTWLRYVNPSYWVSWYVGFLLESILTFVIVLAFWLGALTVGFHEVEEGMPRVGASAAFSSEADAFVKHSDSWTRAFTDSFSSIVSVGTPLHTRMMEDSGDKVTMGYALSCLGMGIGFLHLGILISHLYSVVARKG